MGGALRPFAQGTLDAFKATSGTVFAGDPNADASDVAGGIIRTSGSVALGAGAAGAAGGGGFFGNTGGLTSSAGGVGATGSVGSAGATIPFTTAVPGSAVSAGTTGAGFFGGGGALGLSAPGGVTQASNSSGSSLFNRQNVQRAVNQARRQRGNQQQAPNAARNEFLDRRDEALFRAAATGDPAAISSTAILGGGQLFGRALQDSLGSPDPRELQARLVQEAALEASGSDAVPGTPEYTKAITEAFASRGLGTESLAAQAQGKQLEREQSKQALDFARLAQIQAQTRELSARALGDGSLSVEQLAKSDDGRRALARAGQEVRALDAQRRAQGLPPMTDEEKRAERKLRGSYYFDQQGRQTKVSKVFNPATGVTTTNTSQDVPIVPYDEAARSGAEPARFAEVQEARQDLAASQRVSSVFQDNVAKGTPPAPALSAAKATAALAPTVENPVAPPASIGTQVKAASQGRTTLRPQVTDKPRGTQELDARRKEARALQTEINDGIDSLNRLVSAVDKLGARRTLTVGNRFIGELDLTSISERMRLLAMDAIGPLAGGGREELLVDSRKRLELQGIYQQQINAIVKAQKGVASDGDVARFERELMNPGSDEAQLLQEDGTLINAYVKHYKAILDRAENAYRGIQSDRPIRLNEIHPAIRRILQQERR